MVGMTEADVKSLTKKGVLTAQDGLYDSARALVSISRHLVKTRDTADAKARAAEAQASKAEAEAQRALVRLQAAKDANAEPGAPDEPGGKKRRQKRTPAMENRILARLEEGMSLKKACDGEIDPAQVLRWVKQCLDFAQKYALAREIGFLLKVDRILDLLEEAHEAARDPEYGSTRLVAIKLEIDTLKWLLAKMLPKVYGDKASVHVVGAGGSEGACAGSGEPTMGAEEEARLIASIAERQARLMRMQEAEEREGDTDS